MRIIAKKKLKDFWDKHPESKITLQDWYAEAEIARWNTPQCIKNRYRTASFLTGNRVVFNIGGNKFRLIVKVNYAYRIIYLRFIGTHSDYDHINPETI